jgi:hypothetical protein
MSVQTVRSLARDARRLNQLNRKIEATLATMRAGAALYCLHRSNSSTLWTLSTGQPVTTVVARLITQHAEVEGCGDSLFNQHFSQTWRFIGR